MFSGASDEIEPGSQKGAWQIAQKAQLVLARKGGQWTTSAERFTHRLSPLLIHMNSGSLVAVLRYPAMPGKQILSVKG